MHATSKRSLSSPAQTRKLFKRMSWKGGQERDFKTHVRQGRMQRGEKSLEWPSVAYSSSSSSPDYYASVSRKGKGGEEREEGPVRTYVRTQTLFSCLILPPSLAARQRERKGGGGTVTAPPPPPPLFVPPSRPNGVGLNVAR